MSKIVLGCLAIVATAALGFAGQSWAESNKTLVTLVRDMAALSGKVDNVNIKVDAVKEQVQDLKVDLRRVQEQVSPAPRR